MSKANQMKIQLCSFDHKLLEGAVQVIVDTAHKSGAHVIGPVPLPNKCKKFTVLRSPHVNKDSRVQFELITHKRIVIIIPNEKTVDDLMRLNLSSGVEVAIS
ncbi:MAG: 30S ribosomal protein S10 [Candidatus Comchoanobacterales bacterium]